MSILSIDFSKAFNRMSHRRCLDALERKGASNESLNMVAAFLDRREMHFKVNATLSSPRHVRGGSPQGTRLGNFLFIITIEDIENSVPRAIAEEREEEHGGTVSQANTTQDELGLRYLAGRIGPLRRFNSGVTNASTPCKKDTGDGVLRYADVSGRSILDSPIPKEQAIVPVCWKSVPPWADKYVDDLNLGQKHCINDCPTQFSTAPSIRSLHAAQCEERFISVRDNATSLGMKVNEAKTQLLCMSGANFCRTTSYINLDDGSVIESQDTLTILGFAFGVRPDISSHISLIKRKFGARSWIIRQLSQLGVDSDTLVKVYSATIRSVIELSLIHI